MLTSIRALSRSASRAWAPHLARLKTTEVEKAKGNAAVSAIYQQAPNYPTTWSDSQQTRKGAMTGPRFEQTDLESQPRPLASIELINEVPIKFVKGRKAVCDGGKGPLGHPKIYINLDKSGEPEPCGYCGLRFQQDPSSDHHHH